TRNQAGAWTSCEDEELADQRKLQIIPIFYKVSATTLENRQWRSDQEMEGSLECVSNKMVLPTQYSFFGLFQVKISEADFVKEMLRRSREYNSNWLEEKKIFI
ncbi:hypothetical protein HID58_028206, partial [Brassica napus]